MDLEVLKRKISTYRGEGGKLRNISDELLPEILYAWEEWTGSTKGFYQAVGVDKRKMAAIIGKAKKMKREGLFPNSDFKEIRIEEETGQILERSGCQGVELVWDDKKLIRFFQVDQLLDFLKKAA